MPHAPLLLLSVILLILQSFASFPAALASESESTTIPPTVTTNTNDNIPILMMHGITADYKVFDIMRAVFASKLPHAVTIPIDVCNNIESFENLPLQLIKLEEKIGKLQKEHNFEKFHLLCHSQGSLLCRSLAASWDNHQIQKLVLLSGPLVGQYGVPPVAYLPEQLKNITTFEAHVVLYHRLIQETFSVANMWRDPFHYEEYLHFNNFMTRLYNETSTTPADIERSHRFRENMLRVKHVYMFGSPGDEVIIPYQSAFLGYWNPEDPKRMLSMEEQKFFQRDECGFRTLQKEKRLTQTLAKAVRHMGWVHDTDVIVKYVIPLFS